MLLVESLVFLNKASPLLTDDSVDGYLALKPAGRLINFGSPLAPHLAEEAEHFALHLGAQVAAKAVESDAARIEAAAIFDNKDKCLILITYFFGAHLAEHLGAHLGAHFGAHLAEHLGWVAETALVLHFGAQAANAETLDKANADVTAIADKIDKFFI